MYNTKKNDYFANIRLDLLKLIPKENRGGNLLEIGAGGGNTLMFAKQNAFASNVYGIDICHIENSYQSDTAINRFQIGDIEHDEISFEQEKYDIIICGDVLEHLKDPWSVLNKLKSYLSKDGIIIVSIPNIREISTLYKIFFLGDFQYTNSGILDRTHLRFFCKKNIRELFFQTDLKIFSLTHSLKHNQGKRLILNYLTFGLFEEFLTIQYHVVAGHNSISNNNL